MIRIEKRAWSGSEVKMEERKEERKEKVGGKGNKE